MASHPNSAVRASSLVIQCESISTLPTIGSNFTMPLRHCNVTIGYHSFEASLDVPVQSRNRISADTKVNAFRDDIVTLNSSNASMRLHSLENCSRDALMLNRGLQLSVTSRFEISLTETPATKVLLLRAPKAHTAQSLTRTAPLARSKATYMSFLLCEHLGLLVNNDQRCPNESDQDLLERFRDLSDIQGLHDSNSSDSQQLKNLNSLLPVGHSCDWNGFPFRHSNDNYSETENKPLMTKLASIIQLLHDLDVKPIHAMSSGSQDDSTMTSHFQVIETSMTLSIDHSPILGMETSAHSSMQGSTLKVLTTRKKDTSILTGVGTSTPQSGRNPLSMPSNSLAQVSSPARDNAPLKPAMNVTRNGESHLPQYTTTCHPLSRCISSCPTRP